MMPESSLPRLSGQAVRVGQSLSAAEMAEGEWHGSPGPRLSGQMVRVCQALPSSEMVAGESEGVCLELILTLAEEADANRVLGKVVKLVESLHAYEQSLGGAGLQWDRQRSVAQQGSVQLILVPNKPANTDSCLQSLAELIRATVAEFKDVQTVLARVSGNAA